MALRIVSLEQKLVAVEMEVAEARHGRRDPGSPAQAHYEALKSIAKDLQARMELPRSNALGELERAIERLIRSKTGLGYDEGHMNAVAQVVVNKWPTISMALERFGEESCE
jgi:hypothetical protein